MSRKQKNGLGSLIAALIFASSLLAWNHLRTAEAAQPKHQVANSAPCAFANGHEICQF
jgi:hypothetical protein